MTSKVEICNLALGNIRAASINAIDESSVEAQVCKARYDLALKFMLRDFPWRFSHKVQALALESMTPNEWDYAYTYPTDCLRAKYILPTNQHMSTRTAYYHLDLPHVKEQIGPVQFEVGFNDTSSRKVILTDQDEAYLAYTAYQTDTTNFDPLFIEALGWYLASLIAVPIVGIERGKDLRDNALQAYGMTLPYAQEADANEGTINPSHQESPTITERL